MIILEAAQEQAGPRAAKEQAKVENQVLVGQYDQRML